MSALTGGVPGPTAGVLACLVGLALMGLLPVAFFRRGRLTGGWWMTASPFLLAAATLVAALAGALDPLAGARTAGAPDPTAAAGTPWTLVFQATSVVLVVCAAALAGLAAGSHAAPVALWHQEEDTPTRLTTGGAYARIRHPFYAAFLLLLLSCVFAFPHPLTVAAWLAGTAQLRRTAVREERRILASRHGEGYRAYMRKTGRFVPSLGRLPPSPAGMHDARSVQVR